MPNLSVPSSAAVAMPFGRAAPINSVWKVADIVLNCTAHAPEQRPNMSDVVAQLQECLELEAARGDKNAEFYTAGSGGDVVVDNNSSIILA